MSAIIEVGRSAWRRSKVDSTGVLVDGSDYYRAVHDAAQTARHSLLFLGWQFDSSIPLLRGDEARQASAPVELLPFLTWLCEQRPQLHVHILAWDWSLIYAHDREWLQHRRFENSHARIHFAQDDCHPVSASHHQKLLVVDQTIALVGSMDLARHRWDRREHRAQDPLRCEGNGKGENYPPNHEVQSWITGAAAADLSELFQDRWQAAGQNALEMRTRPHRQAIDWRPRNGIALPAREVAISRTLCKSAKTNGRVREVQELLVAALTAARSHIYLETQYLTSYTLRNALLDRLRVGPSLQLVIILPESAEALSEEVALVARQRDVLRQIIRSASQGGHRVAILNTLAGPGCGTYIHSKLLLVDDRFLTIGSANATDRSMGLDSELNLAWEAADGDKELSQAMRQTRRSLLAEHAGVRVDEVPEDSLLAEALLELARSESCRLRPYQLSPGGWRSLLPRGFGIDPKEEDFEGLPGSTRRWWHRIRRIFTRKAA